jgi:hypothetical protein
VRTPYKRRKKEMKYFSYAELAGDGDAVVITKSEEQILKEYWDYWHEQMCKKYPREYVDSNYTEQDCIEDWIVVHWAQEKT